MKRASDDTIGRTRALEALDLAQRATPFCDRCGQPMLPVARGASSLWLECASLQHDRPLVRRLLGVDHDRRIISDEAA